MKAYELINWLRFEYPETAAEEWDNVGLLVGDDRKEIKRILVALDATESVVREAAEEKADMLITHHPMIFSGIKKINNYSDTGRKIMELIENRIVYYAMHTNYDILGMAELSAGLLELADQEVLSETGAEGDRKQGFGRVGNLPRTMTLKECAAYVKKCNALSDVRVYGSLNRQVKRLAICTGSGKSMIRDALISGADVYVTGDIDYHTAIDAMAEGLSIIDAGHYGTEYIFMDAMKNRLAGCFPELSVSCARMSNPFTVI